MKKYSTLLLSSSLLLSLPATILATTDSLSPSSTSSKQPRLTVTSTAAAKTQTTDKKTSSPSTSAVASSPQTQKVTTPQTASSTTPSISLSQNGQNLLISHPSLPNNPQTPTQFAIWSDKNGQDDIKWITAQEGQTTISLSHFPSGSYTLHSYAMVDNELILIEESHFTVTPPKPSFMTNQPEPGVIDITVSNISSDVKQVKIPVWSIDQGQDDIKWYTAQKESDGYYRLRVYIKDHHFSSGNYAIHLYQEDQSGKLTFLNKAEVTISKADSLAAQKPTIAIENLQASKGKYRISIRERTGGKPVKSVQVATWSTSDQSNIKWRTASLQNGSYLSDIDFQEHKSLPGLYQNHVYVTYTDGNKVGYIADTIDLSNARLPLKFEASVKTSGTLTAKLSNVYEDKTVRFAVWSDENGQDDLKWYTASKPADKTYTADIPLNQHKGIGKYHVHAYQDKGLGAFSTTISSEQKYTKTTNTYPIGQCTWGAKELAPWVENYWGNGGQWTASARSKGFRTGTTPIVGAVAVWTDGGYGHVAVVTEVASSTRIRVKEANYAGKQYIADFRGWFNPVSDGVTAYIYPS